MWQGKTAWYWYRELVHDHFTVYYGGEPWQGCSDTCPALMAWRRRGANG